MKKIIALAVMAIIASASVNAQDAKDLARQQAELNEINMKLLNMKPSKSAKKQAKSLKNEGWTVMAGGQDMEHQITKAQLLGEERTTNEEGSITNRYILNTSMSTAGTYNAAFATARYQAQQEIASTIETEIVALMEGKVDNDQHNAVKAVTVEKFHERSKAIVDQALTNTLVPLAIYRRLSNNNFEVQVTIALDKKEVANRIKNNLRRELELEGDELLEDIDEVFNSKL